MCDTLAPGDSASQTGFSGVVEVSSLLEIARTLSAVGCSPEEFVSVFKECGQSNLDKYVATQKDKLAVISRLLSATCGALRVVSRSGSEVSSRASSGLSGNAPGPSVARGKKARCGASVDSFAGRGQLSRIPLEGYCYSRLFKRQYVGHHLEALGQWPCVQSILRTPASQFKSLEALARLKCSGSSDLLHVEQGSSGSDLLPALARYASGGKYPPASFGAVLNASGVQFPHVPLPVRGNTRVGGRSPATAGVYTCVKTTATSELSRALVKRGSTPVVTPDGVAFSGPPLFSEDVDPNWFLSEGQCLDLYFPVAGVIRSQGLGSMESSDVLLTLRAVVPDLVPCVTQLRDFGSSGMVFYFAGNPARVRAAMKQHGWRQFMWTSVGCFFDVAVSGNFDLIEEDCGSDSGASSGRRPASASGVVPGGGSFSMIRALDRLCDSVLVKASGHPGSWTYARTARNYDQSRALIVASEGQPSVRFEVRSLEGKFVGVCTPSGACVRPRYSSRVFLGGFSLSSDMPSGLRDQGFTFIEGPVDR